MSKRGLSLQEKRQRLEQHFHETGEFFQLKELEKIGPKKGIVAQSVKDVVQSLVDDGLVTMDKIANSNYFWSFPSTAAKARQKKLQDLREKVQQERDKVKALQEAIQAAKAGREPTEFREQVLEELKRAQQEQRELLQELQRYKDNDPATYQEKEKGIIVAKEAANRWTENIWALQSYCVNKFGMDRREFEKAFGLPDDFDTLP